MLLMPKTLFAQLFEGNEEVRGNMPDQLPMFHDSTVGRELKRTRSTPGSQQASLMQGALRLGNGLILAAQAR